MSEAPCQDFSLRPPLSRFTFRQHLRNHRSKALYITERQVITFWNTSLSQRAVGDLFRGRPGLSRSSVWLIIARPKKNFGGTKWKHLAFRYHHGRSRSGSGHRAPRKAAPVRTCFCSLRPLQGTEGIYLRHISVQPRQCSHILVLTGAAGQM